jgi:hypothetical protein
MTDFFQSIINIQSPFNMIVVVVLIGSVAGVIGTIAKQIRKFACHRGEMQLKRELVERGLSVEEIERVIAAKSPIEKYSDG